MVNQTCYQLGSAPSMIRELFAYGLQQAAILGPDKVYDYSLGNPSIPAPAKVEQSIRDILSEVDSIKIHGYSMAAGFDSTRRAIADNLGGRTTTVVVAQRVSSVMGADVILVIDEGRIIGLGDHEKLLAECAVYREISESQMGGAILE